MQKAITSLVGANVLIACLFLIAGCLFQSSQSNSDLLDNYNAFLVTIRYPLDLSVAFREQFTYKGNYLFVEEHDGWQRFFTTKTGNCYAFSNFSLKVFEDKAWPGIEEFGLFQFGSFHGMEWHWVNVFKSKYYDKFYHISNCGLKGPFDSLDDVRFSIFGTDSVLLKRKYSYNSPIVDNGGNVVTTLEN